MGITLTAFVELRAPKEPWARVSTWHLGKGYALMDELQKLGQHDWPLDVHDRDHPSNDFERFWLDTDNLLNIDLLSLASESNPVGLALAASLVSIHQDRAGQTRVLFIII